LPGGQLVVKNLLQFHEKMETMNSKTYNDPIHGHIEIPFHCNQFIDTPQFQRLRDVKQLGLTYYVYMGATHNRFEHSIGVCYLAGKMLKHLHDRQPELKISSNDLKIIQLAGLCHDLGHGPFSHAFEHWLANIGISFQHENMSVKMLNYLIDDNAIDIPSEDIHFVEDLILGNALQKYHDKLFMFDIVANKRNSVDVDKFDYLARDCYMSGIKSSYDFSRLLKFCRVIDDEVCFDAKEVYNVYEMFHTRYSLFKTVYAHRVGRALEYMVGDALEFANPVFKITEKINDPKKFLHLTDSILHLIEASESEELAPSKAIIHRIRKRHLYKFVDEFLVPPKVREHLKIRPADIITHQSDCTEYELRENDVIVDSFVVNYGSHLNFYRVVS